ncbi:hypothetical protein AB0K15_01905 [Amycolatopsis sp. NPDC049253]
MPAESSEENTPTTVPPVPVGTPPHGGGTTTQPDGAHDPYDDPATAK